MESFPQAISTTRQSYDLLEAELNANWSSKKKEKKETPITLYIQREIEARIKHQRRIKKNQQKQPQQFPLSRFLLNLVISFNFTISFRLRWLWLPSTTTTREYCPFILGTSGLSTRSRYRIKRFNHCNKHTFPNLIHFEGNGAAVSPPYTRQWEREESEMNDATLPQCHFFAAPPCSDSDGCCFWLFLINIFISIIYTEPRNIRNRGHTFLMFKAQAKRKSLKLALWINVTYRWHGSQRFWVR